MVSIKDELEAAKQAQTVIGKLSVTSASNPNIVATLRNAKDKAIQAQSQIWTYQLQQFRRVKPLRDFRGAARAPSDERE
jgi:hypothetical protein